MSEFPILAEELDSILVKTFFFFFFSFFWRPPVFGQKNRWNFRFWPKNQTQFRRRPFFFLLETTCFWAGKSLEFPILAEKSDSISAKLSFFLFFFFFWRRPVFEWKKRLNFRAFREIPSRISDKPCETDSRIMKIRVKVLCTFLTLSKNPPLFQILATRLMKRVIDSQHE